MLQEREDGFSLAIMPRSMPEQTLHLYIDGASQGNPGEASVGVLVKDAQGTALFEVSERIGRTTNNVAEYTALVRGLIECLALKAQTIKVFSDSELLIRQMNAEYKVRHPELKVLNYLATQLSKKFRKVDFCHLPREENRQADRLARAALNRGG